MTENEARNIIRNINTSEKGYIIANINYDYINNIKVLKYYFKNRYIKEKHDDYMKHKGYDISENYKELLYLDYAHWENNIYVLKREYTKSI